MRNPLIPDPSDRHPYYQASEYVGQAGKALHDLQRALKDVDDPHHVAELMRELFLAGGPVPRLADLVRDVAVWAHQEGLTKNDLHASLLDDSTTLSRLAWRLSEAGDQIDHQVEELSAGQVRSQAALARSSLSTLAADAYVLQGNGATIPTAPAASRTR
ncbi:hypothetical protein ABZW30_08220 [Kitasatospora sp. NPDC004669]|uniref:hypothetical protein n=1 Tax=Kitasatospora sp. NPDC004669 TaxID=3154555 RepID=UPI0033A69482